MKDKLFENVGKKLTPVKEKDKVNCVYSYINSVNIKTSSYEAVQYYRITIFKGWDFAKLIQHMEPIT